MSIEGFNPEAEYSNMVSELVSSIFAPPTEEELQAIKDRVKQQQLDQDVLERSLQKQAEMGIIVPASQPILQPPELGTDLTREFAAKIGAVGQDGQIDFTLLALKIQNSQNDMIGKLLNAWNENVRKEIKVDKEWRESPVTRALEETLKDGTAAFAQHNAFLSMFILGAGFIVKGNEFAKVDEVSKNSIPISVQVMHEMVPSDMRAELGLLGSLMANYVLYQTVVETLIKTGGGKGGEEKLNRKFAENYANRLVGLLQQPDFTQFLQKIVTYQMQQSPEAKKASPEEQKSWVASTQLGMLLSALALFYKAETGGMTGAEVAGWAKNLLSKEIDPRDPKAPLIGAMRNLLSQLSPKDRQAAIERIMDFLDTKPSVKDLTNPLKVATLLTKDVYTDGVYSPEGGIGV